jgi:hypothetical protein
VKSAAFFDGIHLGLRSLEVRTGLEEEAGKMLDEIDKIQGAWNEVARSIDPPRPHPCEFGLVLHFIRDRRGGTLKGLPNAAWLGSAADPEADLNYGFRYADFYRTAWRQAHALGEVLREHPDKLLCIRGLDVCTDELGVPTWVLRPLLRYVRQCAQQAREQLRYDLRLQLPALRTTIHAGEDFVHLLTGLRNLHQTIMHFELSSGDRIGHGLALGIDALHWSQKSNRVPITIECRLRDLIWELSWYRAEGTEPRTGRWHWVEEEVSRLTECVLGKPVPWQVLFEAHNLLLDGDALSCLLGFPDNPSSPLAHRLRQSGGNFELDAHAIAYLYLTDADVFRKSHQVLWVDHLSEASVVEQLQKELRKKVCEAGLTIEVNPTSNLLIGDFHDLVHHPLWRLKPPKPVSGLPSVSLSIGSDDPLNFATTLPEEFQFVFDAALLAGLSHDDASTWLDQVRQTGLTTRFTMPAPPPAMLVPGVRPVSAPCPQPPP